MSEVKDLTIYGYGANEDIALLADRIKFMLPGGEKFTNNEAYLLAQLSIAYELNPFNGEVWLIKNENTGKLYGSQVGIKGLRKHAKKQSKYWGVGGDSGFKRIFDEKTLIDMGAEKDDLVYSYEITCQVELDTWLTGLERLRAMDYDQDVSREIMGQRPPTTLGIGIYKPGEATKMSPTQCAMFRAEKDAIKRRFDVDFMIPGSNLPVTLADAAEEPDAKYDPATLNGEEIEGEFEPDESIDAMPPITEPYDEDNGKMFK